MQHVSADKVPVDVNRDSVGNDYPNRDPGLPGNCLRIPQIDN